MKTHEAVESSKVLSAVLNAELERVLGTHCISIAVMPSWRWIFRGSGCE